MRRCLDCSKLVHQGPRCGPCQRTRDRQRWQTKRDRYDADWRKTSKAMREAHLAAHGPVCPGFGRAAHVVQPSDLVVDHDWGVACRSCNAAKANTWDRGKAMNNPRHSNDSGEGCSDF